MIRLRLGWALWACCVTWAVVWDSARVAASTDGQMLGTVVDPAGLPVDRATVQVTGAALMGGGSTVVTDRSGAFRVGALPAGPYVVLVRAESFRDVRVENVRVSTSGTVRVDVVMEPPPARGPPVLVANAPAAIVDPEKTHTGLVLDASFLANTPNARSPWLVPSLLPGVQDAPVGGEIAAPGALVANGASARSNRYVLDGFDITDPLTRTALRNINFDAVNDVDVQTGGRSAEWGDAQGAVVNVTTRRGGNAFFADASLYVRPDLWEANRPYLLAADSRSVPQGLNPLGAGDQRSHGYGGLININVGGPIIRDRLWFFVSNQLNLAQDALVSRPGGRVAPRQLRSWWGLGKLTYRPTSWQEFELLIQGDPSVVANALQDASSNADTEVERHAGGSLIGFSSSTRLLERVRFINRVGLYSAYTQDGPQGGDLGQPATLDTATGVLSGNAARSYRDVRNRLQVAPQVAVDWAWLGGTHQTRAGVDFQFSWMRWREDLNGGVLNRTVLGTPTDRVVWDGPRNGWANGDQLGLWVEDQWKPIRSLTVRPGVRVDSARWRDDRMQGPAQGPFEGPQDAARRESTALESVLDATVAQFNVVSPRLSVAWDPFNDGRTNLHASYARYADSGWLAIPVRTSSGAAERVETYNAVTGRYEDANVAPPKATADPGMRGLDVRDLPRSAADVDVSRPWAPRLRGADPLQLLTGHHVPHTDEFILGVTRELVPSVALTANGILRVGNNQLEDVESNLIWSADGSQALGGRNGLRQTVWNVGTPDRAYGVYYGLELMLQKQLTDSLEGMVHYTLGINRGTTGGPFSPALDNPSRSGNAFGYLPQDRRHMLRVLGNYRLPLGFALGGSFSYLSGQPYSAYQSNRWLGGMGDLVARRGVDPANASAELRTPDTVLTNLRGSWDTKAISGVNLQLIVDVQNVLNLRAPTAVDERAGPTLGAAVLSQDPVQFSLGARFQY